MSTDFNLKKKGRYTDPQPNARILTEKDFFDTELSAERNSHQSEDSEVTVDEDEEEQFHDAADVTYEEVVDTEISYQEEVSSPESPTAIGDTDSGEDELQLSPMAGHSYIASDDESVTEISPPHSPNDANHTRVEGNDSAYVSTETQRRKFVPAQPTSIRNQSTSQHTTPKSSTAPRQSAASRHDATKHPRQEAESSTTKKRKLTTPTGKGKLTIRKKAVPWTKEEKDALEAGLMWIKGPFWSEIKVTYSEALHRRTNVDLKDKARNEINAMKRRGKKPKAGTAYYYVNKPEPNNAALSETFSDSHNDETAFDEAEEDEDDYNEDEL